MNHNLGVCSLLSPQAARSPSLSHCLVVCLRLRAFPAF